ncbi:MAG: pirin family protein [Chloroflexia bacterium]|nr:pirin family protein [Chloroflexia bacterium]
MEKIIYRAKTRGHFQNEWLNTWYSFSFADYYDRNRMNFGFLRVLNDDVIQPSTGFGKHPHDNMEIITIPTRGELMHKDSMGHKQTIRENEVQVMSAGTGIFHSEFNENPTEEVKLFQIWIYPAVRNIKPRYEQKFFEPKEAQNQWQLLVSSFETKTGALNINQNAKISRTFLDIGKSVDYKLSEQSYGSFVFVVDGEVEIDNETIGKRDAIGIIGTENFDIKANAASYVLNIEVPARN